MRQSLYERAVGQYVRESGRTALFPLFMDGVRTPLLKANYWPGMQYRAQDAPLLADAGAWPAIIHVTARDGQPGPAPAKRQESGK